MVLFFETFSILQTLFLLRYIRKASVIYFHSRMVPSLPYHPRTGLIVKTLIRLISRKVRIETLPAERINEHNWTMNKRALDVVEGLAAEIRKSASYQIVVRILEDENILKYYKAQLVDLVSGRLLFFRVAKDLISSTNAACYIVPASNDNSHMQKESIGEETLNRFILPGSFVANQVRNLLHKVEAIVLFVFLPSGYLLREIRRVTFRKVDRKSCDVGMPVIWGFHEGDVIIDGVRRQQDDGYLYGDDIRPGRIVHIFNYWRFPPETKAKYKELMRLRGIPYLDQAEYEIGLKLLGIFAGIQLSLLKHSLASYLCWRDRPESVMHSAGIVYSMLQEHLEFENVDYRVEFLVNDYNPSHIVRTILCHKNNKKTVGWQHVASPWDLPQLAYVHMDRYIVYSEPLVRNFQPYWQDIRLERTGRENIDWVVNVGGNEELLHRLRTRVQEKYGKRKYLAVVLLPSSAEYNLRKQWDEMYEALRELRNVDLDTHIFLRVRAKDYLQSEHIRRFGDLPTHDSRIIIDHESFTTYELIALSNLCIANCASFAVFEASSAGAKVFTFDFMGTAKYFFPDFGKDFVLYTKEDLLRVFRGLENNFAGFQCAWEWLKAHGNYHEDGHNLSRIQKVVAETVCEARMEIGRRAEVDPLSGYRTTPTVASKDQPSKARCV